VLCVFDWAKDHVYVVVQKFGELIARDDLMGLIHCLACDREVIRDRRLVKLTMLRPQQPTLRAWNRIHMINQAQE
jgi:hypothetical protein